MGSLPADRGGGRNGLIRIPLFHSGHLPSSADSMNAVPHTALSGPSSCFFHLMRLAKSGKSPSHDRFGRAVPGTFDPRKPAQARPVDYAQVFRQTEETRVAGKCPHFAGLNAGPKRSCPGSFSHWASSGIRERNARSRVRSTSTAACNRGTAYSIRERNKQGVSRTPDTRLCHGGSAPRPPAFAALGQ
jgi:hypothetical protein